MENRAITVSQLNNYIKRVFDAEELLHGVEVVGEIDGLREYAKVSSSGNTPVYFSLKDKEASIPCVCYNPQKLKDIKNGSSVVVRGTVSYWHKAGKISFVVTHCESFGFGQLFMQFEALKKKLEAEGFFDIGIKKPLPAAVKRIGVVTSKSGAVLHDIKTVAWRRNPGVDIILYPSSVQGTDAAREIAEGINFFALNQEPSSIKPVDIIIVARGGGSKEDLAAFNSECVARAVFASKVPVISAVGHETDFTLIDFVADLRAATPSAAAELVVPEVTTTRQAAIRVYKHLRYTLKSKYQTLFSRIAQHWSGLRGAVNIRLGMFESRVRELSGFVEMNNPLAVLRRGYAKVYLGEQEVSGIEGLQINDKIEVKLYNGNLSAKVEKIYNRANESKIEGEK